MGTVELINFLKQQADWKNTAILLSWDNSDGWYDHAYTNPMHASFDPQADQLDGPGKCGTGTQPNGVDGKPVNGRCGPGTRIPFLVIPRWTQTNHVDHTPISLNSVVRFIEDNWLHGERLAVARSMRRVVRWPVCSTSRLHVATECCILIRRLATC